MSALTERNRWFGWIAQTGYALVVLYQFCWIIQYAEGLYRPGPMLTGQEPYSTTVSTIHGGLNMCPWNSMTDDLKKLPDSSRIYILGNEQVFGFPKRFWYSSCHDDTPLVLWANAATDAADLYRKMKSENFTHVLINAPEAVRLEGYSLFEWTDHGRQVFRDFGDNYLKLVDVKPVDRYPNALFLFAIEKTEPTPQFTFHAFFEKVLKL
jgi:hypothetical protein